MISDPARAENYLRNLANPAPALRLSAKKKDGLAAWFDWLRQERAAQRHRAQQGQKLRPAIQPEGARLHVDMAQADVQRPAGHRHLYRGA